MTFETGIENWSWVHFLFPLASFLVALASLILSVQNYLRDAGRLDVAIALKEIIEIGIEPKKEVVIYIEVVNSGRRPITLTGVGGDYSRFFFRVWASLILPKIFIPTSFVLAGININSLFWDIKKNQNVVLTEGEVSKVIIPINDDSEKIIHQFENMEKFIVWDTLGRKHFASRKIVLTFKNDLQKLRTK